jgi:hypothetical protein
VTHGSLRGLIPAAVGAIAVLALVGAALPAAGGAAAASAACTNATIDGGKSFGTVTYRFVLTGDVSCVEAHRTMRAYVRAIVAGRCPTRICTQVVFPGGWTCSSASAVERGSGSPLAGCVRSGASFDAYKAGGSAGTLHLTDFLSLDRKVWCGVGNPFFCVTGGNDRSNPPQRGARLSSDGTVVFCYVPVPDARQQCTQNCDPHATVLRSGQHTEQQGVRCTASAKTITCTRIAGKAKGKGFVISATSARRVGP